MVMCITLEPNKWLRICIRFLVGRSLWDFLPVDYYSSNFGFSFAVTFQWRFQYRHLDVSQLVHYIEILTVFILISIAQRKLLLNSPHLKLLQICTINRKYLQEIWESFLFGDVDQYAS
jgi:hypothetical protein